MAGSASSIYYNYDGTVLTLGRGFIGTVGIQHPANWLEVTSDEEKLAIGITIGVAPPYFDSRFWSGYDDNGDLIPLELEDQKTVWIDTDNYTAHTLLEPNDWYVTRKYERNVDIPVGVSSFRSEVVGVSSTRTAMISATTDMSQLENLVTGVGTDVVGFTTTLLPAWPSSVDYF